MGKILVQALFNVVRALWRKPDPRDAITAAFVAEHGPSTFKVKLPNER